MALKGDVRRRTSLAQPCLPDAAAPVLGDHGGSAVSFGDNENVPK